MDIQEKPRRNVPPQSVTVLASNGANLYTFGTSLRACQPPFPAYFLKLYTVHISLEAVSSHSPFQSHFQSIDSLMMKNEIVCSVF
jgi:hypothetical protein